MPSAPRHTTTMACVLFATICSPAAAQNVAMITDLLGTCTATVHNETATCDILASFETGAIIDTQQGTSLSLVYFESGGEYRFKGNARIEVAAHKPVVNSGEPSEVKGLTLVRKLKRPTAQLKQTAFVMRSGVKRKKRLQLVSPTNTVVLNPQPTFKWSSIDTDAQYRFSLTDESGQVILESLTETSSITLPSSIRLASGEWYSWEVEARLTTGAVYSSIADFRPATDRERGKIEQSRPGKTARFSEQLTFAMYLDQLGFKDEARKLWRELASLRPRAKTLARTAE